MGKVIAWVLSKLKLQDSLGNVINPRKEDGHGSSLGNPSFVQTTSSVLPTNAAQETGGNLSSLSIHQTDGTQKTQMYDGSNVIGTSTHPIRIDTVGTTTQPISGIVGVKGADGLAILSRDNFLPIGAPQVLDSNNTTTLTNTGSTYTGIFTRTRSSGFIGQIVIISSDVSSGLGGTFTFQFSEDGSTPTINESRVITDFSSVRDFPLQNVGEWFRVIFTPSRTLTTSEHITIATTHKRTLDPPFVRLANQEIEEQNAAMSQTFSYIKAFDETTGSSVNVRPTEHGDLRVGYNAVIDTNNSTTSSGVLLPVSGTFTGDWTSVKDFAAIIATGKTEPFGGTFSAVIDWSNDGGTTVNHSNTVATGVPSGIGASATFAREALYFRSRITNTGSIDLTLFNTIVLSYMTNQLTQIPIFAPVQTSSTATLVKSVGVGKQPGGNYVDTPSPGISDINSSTTLLTANSTFTGDWVSTVGFTAINVTVNSDQASVNNGLSIEFSDTPTGVVIRGTAVRTYTSALVNTGVVFTFNAGRGSFFRVKYTNGNTGQNSFYISSYLLTTQSEDAQSPLTSPITSQNDAIMVRSVETSPNITDGTFEILTQTQGDTLTTKFGRDVSVLKHHVDTPIKAPTDYTTGQVNINNTSPVQIAASSIPNRVSVSIKNTSPIDNLYIGRSSSVSTSTGYLISPLEPYSFDIGPNAQIWGITDSSSVSIAQSNRSGTTGSTVAGSPSNPNNSVSADNVYATLNAVADSIQVSGYTVAGTYPNIQQIKIGVEMSKQSGQVETVGFQDVVTGISTGTSVSSGTVTASSTSFYVVSISRKNTSASVTGVSGLGLTWTPLDDVSNGTDSRISVYYSTGTGIGSSGVVTANFSTTSTNAVIAVSRYSKVKFSAPIDNHSTLTGTTNSISGSITGTNKGMAVLSIASRERTNTPGSGFVEQNETAQNAGGGGASTCTQSIDTLTLSSTGSQTFSGTLSGNAGWSLIALTLAPSDAINPIVTLSYKLGGVTGATSLSQTLSSTSDATYEVDVTSDRAWIASDIPNVSVIINATTLSAAKAQIDQLYLSITESQSGGNIIVTFHQLGA